MTLAEEVTNAVERTRREDGLGFSEAFNLLARRGIMASAEATTPDTHTSKPMTARIDITKIAQVLDLVESPPES